MTNNQPPTAEPLMDKVDEFLKSLGVEKYVVLMSDPDSDCVAISRGGSDVCWQAGALILQLRQLQREWDKDYGE